MELLVLGHEGENVALDRRGLDLDAVEDRRVEDVDTGVDAVSDVLLGLLYESVNRRRVGVREHDTVLRRLIDLGDLSTVGLWGAVRQVRVTISIEDLRRTHEKGSLSSVGGVEVAHLLEGVRASDIRVENEERRVVLAKNFACEREGASCKGLKGK